MCVLIVDDNADARRALQIFLHAKGYADVITAGSGNEALEVLSADNPESEPRIEVVLLDVNMDGIDGIETCRRIKADQRLRDVPVLMLTACMEDHALESAFAAGACDYIAKPVNVTELLARLRSALNLKHELEQRRARERELVRVTEQLRKLNEELQRLSIVDELTGIANRRFFNLVLAQEWARATRSVLPLSLVMIDIDFFKNYNDHYGHPRGDECLRRVAQCLHHVARRPGDCVARYGGEEFAAILANTGAAGAAVLAEALRKSVEDMGLEHNASPLGGRLTVSLGVATVVPTRTMSADALVAAADRAVYEAKASGRNRVQVYQGVVEQAQAAPQRPNYVIN